MTREERGGGAEAGCVCCSRGPAVTESVIRLLQISSSFNILVEKKIYLDYIWSKAKNRITLSEILSSVFSFHTKSKICANNLNQFG